MMSERKIPKVIFTVLLVNGREISHTYNLPSDRKEAEKFFDYMVSTISTVMTHRKELYFSFNNPSINYNPDHVIGIRFDAVETEELEKAITEAQRKLGFIKD